MPPPKNKMVIGRQPVIEALNSGQTIEKVFLKKGMEGDYPREVKELCQDLKIPFQTVPVEKLNRLTGKNHQGVVLLISEIQYYEIEDILSQAYDSGEIPLFLLLDGITDIHNFGAIARTAWGTGVHGIIVPDRGAATVNEVAIKISAGALLHIPVCRTFSVTDTLTFLKENGLKVVSTQLKENATELHDMEGNMPMCVVMGAEDSGVSAAVNYLSDETIRIPIRHNFDSYNVSVASAMVLYEIMRQKIKS